MTDSMTHSSKHPADVFNRSVLDMSFTLLRTKDPKLALIVRNILFQEIAEKNGSSPRNKHSDTFIVNLDSFQVRAIVEVLNEVMAESQQLDPKTNTSLFRPVLVESILTEWLALARLMFSNLQSGQKN